MGFLSGLGKVLGVVGGIAGAPFTGGASLIPAIAGAAGAGLGALAQGKANNRGEQFGGQLDLERLLMDRDRQSFDQRISREQEGRTGQSDAWQKLLAADYAQHRGQQPHLSPYSVGSRSLGGLQPGADALMQQVMARLQGGNPIASVTERPMNVDPKLLKPGLGESLAGYGAAAAPAIGALFKKKPPIMSADPGWSTGY